MAPNGERFTTSESAEWQLDRRRVRARYTVGMNGSRQSGIAQWAAAAVVFAALLAALRATERDYGYALDEATYRWVAAEVREWFAELPRRSLGESFARAELARRWHFLEDPATRPADRHSNFNLPGNVHVQNLGW